MKTLPIITAVALAVAVAVPAFANDADVGHLDATSQIQINDGTQAQAQAYVPPAQPDRDNAAETVLGY